ncbi:MAG: aminopeptidase [Clostridiales bacterium]|jgi:aminopeptidase|nr:aminopeptidase [Clostridiales bacterium]
MDKKKYAELFVKAGGRVEPGDTVVLAADVHNAPLARMIVESAYEAGAIDVLVRWSDSVCTKMWFDKADDSVIGAFPDWQIKLFEHYDAKKTVYLTLLSEDPDMLGDADPDRIRKWMNSRSKALKQHSTNLISNKFRWSIIAAPSPEWAVKVFPGESPEEAVEKLWNAIAEAARVNANDPVAEWERHNRNFKKRSKVLNEKKFKSLKYKNSLGTDFIVELPKGHIWLGGSEKDVNGITFNPNIPTEEIFTLPHRFGANGRVVSSMPLAYNGKLIENFELTFKDGEAVSFKAEKNQDILESILDNDPGSRRLGEIALVPADSPITRMGILFYETLFDENASCHLALGKAYPSCLDGTQGLSEEELEKLGVNNSLLHVDFMIGTDDLSIIGVSEDGTEFTVFKDGMFTF